MFNLEQTIAKWRKQMLVAGIKSPALDELENHLREEIERQIKSGASEQEAFQRTVLQIGQARELKTEFAKSGGFFGFLGSDPFMRTNRILGMLWLVFSALSFARVCHIGYHLLFYPALEYSRQIAGFVLFLFALYGVGILGSILLLRGAKWGRHIIKIFAAFSLLCGIVFLFKSFSVREGLFTAFFLASVWFLFSQPTQKPREAAE
jgi:hypothetical protein